MSRSAATRKFRNNFDVTPYIELLEAKPVYGWRGMCQLTDGRTVTFSPGKPGKVEVAALLAGSLTEARTVRRTFGVKELDAIREWVLNGGIIEAEEQAKRIRAHAFAMYEALDDLAEWSESVLDVLGPSNRAEMKARLAAAREVLAKVEGK